MAIIARAKGVPRLPLLRCGSLGMTQLREMTYREALVTDRGTIVDFQIAMARVTFGAVCA